MTRPLFKNKWQQYCHSHKAHYQKQPPQFIGQSPVTNKTNTLTEATTSFSKYWYKNFKENTTFPNNASVPSSAFLLFLFHRFSFVIFPISSLSWSNGLALSKPNLHNHLLNPSSDRHQLTVTRERLTEVHLQTLQHFGMNSKTIHMEKMWQWSRNVMAPGS